MDIQPPDNTALLGPRKGISRLSVELLTYIMHFLPGKDLASCQAVSRAFWTVILQSTALQFKIQCAIFSVEACINCGATNKNRLDNLFVWRQVCKTLTWDSESAYPFVMEHPFELKTSGSTYVTLNGAEIRIHQPAVRYRGIPERVWIVDDFGFSTTPVDFAYDVHHELLVVVEFDPNECIYKLHLLSALERERHPSAAKSIISIPAPRSSNHIPIEDHQVYLTAWSNLLTVGLIGTEPGETSEVWVWDWQTYRPLLNFYEDADDVDPGDVVLVGDRHCIIPFEGGQASEDIGFAVFDLHSCGGARKKYADAVQTDSVLFFKLPSVRHENVASLAFDMDLDPSISTFQGADGYFRLEDDTRLLHIALAADLLDGTERRYDIVVPIRVISRFLDSHLPRKAAGPRVVPWDQWSVDARIFSVGPGLETWVSHTRYGVQQPIMYEAEGPWIYYIYDFRPLTQEELEAVYFTPNVVLQGNCIEEDPGFWRVPVQSGARLPYRVIESRVFRPGDNVYMGDDYMVVIEGEVTKIIYSM